VSLWPVCGNPNAARSVAFHAAERSEAAPFSPTFFEEWWPKERSDGGHPTNKKVAAAQFHPEKSGETGLAILRNFVDLCVER